MLANCFDKNEAKPAEYVRLRFILLMKIQSTCYQRLSFFQITQNDIQSNNAIIRGSVTTKLLTYYP